MSDRADTSASPRRPWLRLRDGLRLLPYAAVAALAAAVYLPTTSFGFVFDDRWLVAQNELLREPWSPLRAFARHFWQGTPFGSGSYRPLVTASFAVDGRLSGWSPAGFHATNVLLHAVNSALVLLLARRLGVSGFAAGFAAALFAVHPASAWAVGSIVARVDLMPAFFLLLAWIVWAHPDRAQRPWTAPVLSALFFLAALFCKESAAGFLAVLLLAALRPAHRTPGAETARAAAFASFAAFAIYLAARWLNGIGLPLVDVQINPLAEMPWTSRSIAALELSGRYLLYLALPFRFADPNDYSRPASPLAIDAGVVASAFALLACASVVFLLWWRRDRLALPIAFGLATFLPASNLLMPISSLYAENFLYLPLVGFCLALGELLQRHAPAPLERSGETVARPARRLAPRFWIAATLVLVLGLRSAREVSIWRDMESLFRAWTQRFPNYAHAHGQLGLALLDGGDPHAALAPLRRALEIDDRSVLTRSNLAVALMRTARHRADLEEALRHCQAAIALDPGFANARHNAAQILLLLRETAHEAKGPER